MPNLEITAFARTLDSTNTSGGGALLARTGVSQMITAASEAADRIGIQFRVRETGDPLIDVLAREAPGHDLVLLPAVLGDHATDLDTPMLLV